MFFCEKCDNMYYIKIGAESNSNQLIYYCRNCGHENTGLNNSNICVSKTIVHGGNGNGTNMSHFINEYTKFDPTLPRITTIKCPNQSCITNSLENKVEREVLYIRYDDDNMKYLYLCCRCETKWKTDN